MEEISTVLDWLNQGAPGTQSRRALVKALADRLNSAAVPVDRLALFVRVLNPQITERSFIWERGKNVEIGLTGFELAEPDAYHFPPVTWLRQSGMAHRRRLADEEVVADVSF